MTPDLDLSALLVWTVGLPESTAPEPPARHGKASSPFWVGQWERERLERCFCPDPGWCPYPGGDEPGLMV